MRLFQVLSEIDGEQRGLYSCSISEDEFSNEDIEQVLIDAYGWFDEETDEAIEQASDLLDMSCLERIFVNEIFI